MAYKYLNDNGLKAYTKKVKGALKDLHTPIDISTLNTTESKAQNVRNIADFVAKAKAAGIADVNGMAVSCIIDNDYSAVLAFYYYSDNIISMFGVSVHDDPSEQFVIRVSDDGYYTETPIVTPQNTNIITSEMLTRGARKPIILTSDTTEVDEETYQKLLSDDTDVMFKTQDVDANLCLLTYKTTSGDYLQLFFTCLSVEGSVIDDSYLYAYEVDIAKTSPHTCIISENQNGGFESFFDSSYLKKSILSPVLKEIDLRGTDVQRKARLDQFEIDWKELTGASDLTGARFVGLYTGKDSLLRTALFIHSFAQDPIDSVYEGISMNSDAGYGNISKNMNEKVKVDPYNGSISITPLFSHLEPVEIIPDNFTASKKKNLDNLNAYKANLAELGVDISNGYSVPVRITGMAQEYHGMLNIGTGALLSGIVTDEQLYYPFNVNTTDGAITFDANNYFLEKTFNEVTEMLDAIKYSYTPVLLTTTTSTNKTQLDLFLSKVPNAQVMHCTYKDVYAGTLHKIGTDWFGLLVKNTNNYEDAIQVKLQADGTLIEGTNSLAQVNAKLANIIG